MKIVHLCLGKANPERANGVNRVVHGLATAQARGGTDVEVWGVTPTPGAPTAPREYALKLFATRGRGFASLVARRTLAPELARALGTLSPTTVVHLHGGYQPVLAAASELLGARGVAWVVTPHGAYRKAVVEQAWLKKRAYLALYDAPVLRAARAVHVFSAREATELVAYVPAARTVVLPNGVDPAELAPRAPRTHSRPPAFTFCGRIAAHTKGLDLLVDAWARYRTRGGRGTLEIIGDGRDRAELEVRARTFGADARFRGELFGPALHDALRAADVFLHPSRHEGMPVAVLEAAALGLACIVSDQTNLGEPIARRGAGRVLARNDVEHLVRALLECDDLADRGGLAALGANARDLVTDEHDWRHLARRAWSELYGAAGSTDVRAA